MVCQHRNSIIYSKSQVSYSLYTYIEFFKPNIVLIMQDSQMTPFHLMLNEK